MNFLALRCPNRCCTGRKSVAKWGVCTQTVSAHPWKGSTCWLCTPALEHSSWQAGPGTMPWGGSWAATAGGWSLKVHLRCLVLQTWMPAAPSLVSKSLQLALQVFPSSDLARGGVPLLGVWELQPPANAAPGAAHSYVPT